MTVSPTSCFEKHFQEIRCWRWFFILIGQKSLFISLIVFSKRLKEQGRTWKASESERLYFKEEVHTYLRSRDSFSSVLLKCLWILVVSTSSLQAFHHGWALLGNLETGLQRKLWWIYERTGWEIAFQDLETGNAFCDVVGFALYNEFSYNYLVHLGS